MATPSRALFDWVLNFALPAFAHRMFLPIKYFSKLNFIRETDEFRMPHLATSPNDKKIQIPCDYSLRHICTPGLQQTNCFSTTLRVHKITMNRHERVHPHIRASHLASDHQWTGTRSRVSLSSSVCQAIRTYAHTGLEMRTSASLWHLTWRWALHCLLTAQFWTALHTVWLFADFHQPGTRLSLKGCGVYSSPNIKYCFSTSTYLWRN